MSSTEGAEIARAAQRLASYALGMRGLLALAAATALLASPARLAAQDWYDPEPLLSSVRPALHAELARSAGVARLADLPLYDLELDVDPDRHAFSLEETIWLTNREDAPLSEIVLRIYANSVPGTPPVTVESVSCSGPSCTSRAASPSALVITPEQPLAPGARVRIELRLRGRMQHIDSSRTNVMAQGMESMASLGSGGGHGSDFGLLSVGDGITSLANFYAVLARRRNGQWIEGEASTIGDLGSDAMSHVRAVIRTPRDVRVVATGRAEPARIVRGRRITRVSAGMVRDFSALASRSFDVAERRVGDVTVRSWFLSNERAAGERVLDVAAESLAIFERRFGDYPYVDLDVVEAPLVGGAGGVEFSALVTVASMFYRDGSASAAGGAAGLLSLLGGGGGQAQMQERMREVVVAHEVAHQWWHGLVGSDSRAHPYVDESLAQWSALLYLEERYGPARAREDGDMQVKMGYQMMRLMGHEDGAVDRPADAFGHPIVYAGLVYGKGPYMYQALRRAVGDRAFFAALRRYVDTYRFREAPSRGLVDQLARGRHRRRVRTIARRWLEGTHGDADIGQLNLGPMQGLLGGAAAPGAAAPGALHAPSPADIEALRRALESL